MPHPNAALLTRFYDAFAQRDGDAMAACYHPDATFRDEIFELQGDEPGMMWRMLCERGGDLRVVASGIQANEHSGSAHWEADYTFSQTGRSVHNQIDASFTFENGLIRTHVDRFDFRAWSRQALGLPGLLLGWTPWLRAKVQAQARKNLEAYIATRSA